MADPLTDKLAFVTGASRGIGAATAKALAKQGAHVILAARTIGGLERTHDEIVDADGKATILPLDLKKGEEIDKVGPTIHQRFGKLDIFVGNAGVLGGLRPITHYNPKTWEETFKVNVHANFRLLRTLDPLLRQSQAGRVVMISSGMAEGTEPYWGLYSATKAALNSFVQTYANEIMASDVKVNLIHPGVIKTNMLNEAFPGGYEGDSHTPEEAAEEIVKLCLPDTEQHGQFLKAFG